MISTARMKLKYKKGKGPFTKDNLTITSAKGMLPFEWTPGTTQKGNLKGRTAHWMVLKETTTYTAIRT